MRKQLVAAIAALSVVMAACGDDDDSDDAPSTEATSATEETSASEETSAPEETTAPDATSAPEETESTEEPAATEPEDEGEADPEGIARLSYDLAAASRGGIQFDPAASPSVTSDFGLYHWLYGSLMRPLPDGTLEPDLAESAEVIDPNTIEIVMRDGVTLSDGTPVDAEMVKAVLDRNLAMAENPAFNPQFYSLQSVEVTGPNTLTLGFPDGTAAGWFDVMMDGPETMIVPDGTDFSNPVGAGPFKLVEFVPSQTMTLEKNPEYWDADSIQLAGIELTHVPPDNVQAGVSALQAGQIDWTRMDTTVVDAAGDQVELDIAGDPDSLLQVLVCKTTAPFDDPRIRQALSFAIDRELINEALFNGAGEPAWDYFPVENRLHNPDLTEYYAYDPEQAQALLAEAGAEDITVDIIPIPSAGGPELAQILQQQWGEVGVNTNIVATTAFVDDFLVNNRAPLGIVPRGSPGRGKLGNVSGDGIGNVCHYADPELDALVAELGTVSDSSEEGAEVWGEIQNIVVEDALNILVAFGPRIYGFEEDRFGGYELIPYGIPIPDMWELFIKA